jgi:hypothetical protein
MANPPVNRRPGVDADIFQGQWVRGYDVPAGDQTLPVPPPVDLVISNGKSQINQSVSNLVFASRTDAIGQPIFIMAQGPDAMAPTGVLNFHIGREADPNGLISGVGPGALYASYGAPGLWQLQLDDTTWVKISDDLGGEDLAETLAIGNFTGGTSIRITNGDYIIGVDDTVGVGGAAVNIAGGNALAAVGNGGAVNLQGGTSVGGATGGVVITTPTPSASAASGSFSVNTGNSLLGGSSGSILLRTGNTGAAGIGGNVGTLSILGGNSLTTGPLAVAGGVSVAAGFSQTAGQGGRLLLSAGNATGVTSPIVVVAAAGRGGDAYLIAGNSAASQPGGSVSIAAGSGGSAGAVGGNIVLTPGNGGGGFDQGIVNAAGIFQSTNIKRGSGNPNGVIPGDEGAVYQRTDTGQGEIYLNTNGTINGWAKLAFAGDFVESFEQLNWGYFSRCGQNNGALEEDNYADHGIFKGLLPNDNGTGVVDIGGNLDGGPFVSFEAPNNADVAAVDFSAAGNPLPHATEQQFILTFRARNVFTTNNRIFLGVSNIDAQTQLSTSAPAGANYLGFLLDPALANWRVISNNTLGATILDTGISGVSTAASSDAWYFVIDATDSGIGVIRFFILDFDLNLQSSISAVASLPGVGQPMGLVMGVRKTAADGDNKRLQVVSACIVNDAATVGQGGGVGLGALSLSQVLINGNETGNNPILINQGSGGLLGVTDDNAGDGASFGIFGGATTLAGNDTGSVTVGSGNAVAGGAQNAGASTGSLVLSTGFQTNATSLGNTGLVTLLSGSHAGTDGNTGDIVIATGLFSNGAVGTRTQGDILIAPGTFTPNPSTVTGEIILKGGSSNVVGVTGGDVTIFSGENSSATGNTGGITLQTFDANLTGNSGLLELHTGAAGTVSGTSGNISVQTGQSVAGSTGNLTVSTGAAGNGVAGSVFVSIGSTTVGNGQDINLTAGLTVAGGSVGGNVVLTPGTGPGGDGVVLVNGKLTVTGLIDPTGLLLDGQVAIPTLVPAGNGLLWIDSTGAPSKLIYTDDGGTNHDISTGGGATTLAALTDVNIAGPVVGQVLTYNGVQWQNMAGFGGSPLATILALGNTTGALPIVVSDTLGSRITSDGDLELQPAVAPGNAVVIDGMRWPEADGLGGYVLTTNGLGQLSFQPGGGGTGPTFAEAFAQMQWGAIQASVAPASIQSNGIYENHQIRPAGIPASSSPDGNVVKTTTVAAPTEEAGVHSLGGGVHLEALPLAVFKFDGLNDITTVRHFVGLTTDVSLLGIGTSVQLGGVAPLTRYVGIQLYSDVPQATLHFVTDDATGVPTRVNTTVDPTGLLGLYLVVDGTSAGSVTLTLYDNNYVQLAQTVFAANIPTATFPLFPFNALRTLAAAARTTGMYFMNCVTRADLLNAIGGGGNQNLASVLGFGNDTAGIPIQGTDNGGGSGSSLDLLGGSSTGGGGSGGDISMATGSPDPAGNGSGGGVNVVTGNGAGTGDGGSVSVVTGSGTGTGDGGDFNVATGNGFLAGSGGDILFTCGDGGTAGVPGVFLVVTGDATGGNTAGARIDLRTGDGSGTEPGGGFVMIAGDGGAGGGDGGSFTFSTGAGMGGGVPGIFTFNGDATINGKLTVTGMIDPPGLLMSSSGVAPFVPVGTEGGIWVNAAGELVFTNLGGDLNLSTAIGGGMSFLDALLTAGYGFLGPGNPVAGTQAYGVYGSSAVQAVSPGPPPATITFGDDSDGPFLNLAVGANPLSEAFLGTADLFIRRDQRYRARFKFQVTSPAHTDERIFIGFTEDATLVTPSVQLGTNDPPGIEYVGLREDLAGFTLQFVARGSGGAMAPVFAIPTDALAHYLEIDTSAASGDVTFTLFAADGITVQATHTEPSSFLLPSPTTATRPFTGIFTQTGTTPRGIDFYFSTVITRADVVDAVVMGGGGGGTPTLAAVLGAGNTTGGTSILVDTSIDGDGIDLFLNGGSGGAGSPAAVTVGASVGDNGGDVQVSTGAGAGAAGDGGAFQLLAGAALGTGDGGSVLVLCGDAAVGGGDGGDFLVAAGAAVAVNGAGGNVQLAAGSSFGTAGGGAVALTAGAGGGGGGTGDGGDIILTAGNALGTGDHGGISLVAGNGIAFGPTEGSVQISSSRYLVDTPSRATLVVDRATVVSGGPISLRAGAGAVGSGGDGGDILLQGAIGDGVGASMSSIYLLGAGATVVPLATLGGDTQVIGSTLAGFADGGQLIVAGGSPAVGGTVVMRGGAGVALGVVGGAVIVAGGAGAGVAVGGFAQLSGGPGGALGDGGDAQVRGGLATGGANIGGDVRLIPGTGPGGAGMIAVEGRFDPAPATPGLQFSSIGSPGVSATPGIIDPGLLAPGVPPVSFIVPFNAPFGAPPTNVQVTLAQFIPGAMVLISVAVTTVTPGGFTIVYSAPPPPGLGFYWRAML